MKIGNKEFVFKFEFKKPKFWQVILGIFLVFILSIISLFAYYFIKADKMLEQFASAAELPKETILNDISSWIQNFQTDYQNKETLETKTNFLVMGTDKISGREDSPELTDTMILISLDTEKSTVKTIALPRDLYNQAYQTRVNALYYYGTERYPEDPEQFPQEVIAEMVNLEIDHSIIINIEDLEELIDILGGVQVTVPVAFTDDEFPVSGIDVSTETDPEVLYETISFEVGPQEMDGATALKYMRSRHSENDEGSDNARSKRQQLVLESLIAEIKDIRSPEVLGKLYRFYLDKFEKYISINEIISILTPLYDQFLNQNDFSISFENKQLSIYPEDPQGAIYNPPQWQTNGEWLYQIKDQEIFLESFEDFRK
jgi:anionic cell wall polymer biosynthesis LytR-Cps2A-Psr (LCP) family protein